MLCSSAVSSAHVRTSAVLPATRVRTGSHVPAAYVWAEAVLPAEAMRRKSPVHDPERDV